MAASSVEICNSALILIGAKTISSLSDGTKAANVCNAMYDPMRKEVLRAHPWNFAIAYVALADTGNTPVADHWTNEFTIPTDVLRVLETNQTYDADWELGYNASGNKVLWTNDDSVEIKYIKDITNTTRFDPAFDQTLAMRLAAQVAYSLTQSQSVQQNMYRLYLQSIKDARFYDAQEHSFEEVLADEFTESIRG